MNAVVAVIGLGEIGRPIQRLVERAGHPVVGVDVDTRALPSPGTVDVMHICFPFEIDDFEGEVVRYMELLKPRLTAINSTVAVGTTRSVFERTGAAVGHSPVRGKHARMEDELVSYEKYIGAVEADTAKALADHFETLGMRTHVVASPETTELAKLSETTFFGLLIAWAQQMERYCDQVAVDYAQVASFYDEIDFLPSNYFPGVIGGHCVLPNIEILEQLNGCVMLDAIRSSNAQKLAREAGAVQPST